ncbi:unnamed protein product [Fusarium graminearum]|nr:unnamed protein product [Fusarium graminearum]CAF3595727.1 unnamed protein product [Fusarium graminearum]
MKRMRQYQARPFVVRSVEINSHLPAGEQWQTVLRRCSALAGRNWRPPPLITNNSLQAVDFCNLNLSNTSTFAVSSPTCEMSGHVPSSWQDLPLMGEVGNLCPRLPEPVKSKRPASEVKSTTVEEDGIPDPLMVPEVAPALLKYENHQWACWSCRIKFFVAIKDLMPPLKRSKPNNRLAGIKDPAVRDFIIAAEERLAKAKSGKAPEEKPKCTYPTKFEDIDFSTATVMTTEEDFAAFLEEHPFGLKEPKEGSVRRMFYVDECTKFRCSGSCSGDLFRDTFEQAATSKPALLKTLQFLEDILTVKAEQLGGLR